MDEQYAGRTILQGASNQVLLQPTSHFHVQVQKSSNVHWNLFNTVILAYFSGPLEAVILSHKDNAISRWRELMGPTKVFKAIYTHPDSIRGQFGLTDTRNACHGSDSPESVQREVNIIFPELNLTELYRDTWGTCCINRVIKY